MAGPQGPFQKLPPPQLALWGRDLQQVLLPSRKAEESRQPTQQSREGLPWIHGLGREQVPGAAGLPSAETPFRAHQ